MNLQSEMYVCSHVMYLQSFSKILSIDNVVKSLIILTEIKNFCY